MSRRKKRSGKRSQQSAADLVRNGWAAVRQKDYSGALNAWERAARLLRAAEAAKIELSSHPFAWIREEYIAEKEGVPLHLEYEVERATFEELIADLLADTLDSIDQVLADAEVGIEEVDQILFPHSLGIAVAEWRQGRLVSDRYSVLIRRNTTIPVTREEIFSAVYPDQESVLIKVYQGEEPVASRNDFLGEFVVEGLVPLQAGDLPQVTVAFDFDLDGILHVRAQDRHSARQEEITISASRSRLEETEIVAAQTMLAETETTTASLVTVALVTRAEALLDRGELDGGAQALIEDLLQDIALAQANSNAHRIEELSETLLDLLFDYE